MGVVEVRTSTYIWEHNIKKGSKKIKYVGMKGTEIRLNYILEYKPKGRRTFAGLEGSIILKCILNIIFYACIRVKKICDNFVRDVCGVFLSHSAGVSLLGFTDTCPPAEVAYIRPISTLAVSPQVEYGQFTHVVRK